MMIRSINTWRRGVSLTELAYVLAVASVLLAIVWIKAGALFQDLSVQSASQELQSIVQTARMLHPSGKLSDDEGWSAYILPPGMVGHFQGRMIVFNPWKGAVSIIPGNAASWGADKYNQEFTVRFDGVPSDACVDFVMENATSVMHDLGLNAVYITPEKGKGQEICFSKDSYCEEIVTELNADNVKKLCKAHNPMIVMFTYAVH